jgi:two-component system heavy metal sensor histidine kinase CusS
MSRPSFRLRLAGLSVILAGATLAGFSLVSWWLIMDAKVSRLDSALEAQLPRAAGALLRDLWLPFEQTLPQELGIDASTAVGVQVRDRNGQVLYQSDQWPGDLTLPLSPLPPLPESLGRSRQDLPNQPQRSLIGRPPPPQISTMGTSTGRWRVGIAAFPGAEVAIAVNLSAIAQEMALIRRVFWLAVPGAMGLIAAGAWALSGQALRPVRELTTAIQRITAQGLDRRLPTTQASQEFVPLINSFNQMLERLERSFKQATRFSGDAAHELKTPLAILQGHLERSLQAAAPGSPEQQQLGQLLDEVQRLGGIVRKLLLLSLADAGQMQLHRVTVDVSALLKELVADIELLAPELTVEAAIPLGLTVAGDRDLLTQLLQNLISNAIKYNLPQGWIRLDAQGIKNRVRVTIVNASKTLPEDVSDRLFERFYRQDTAHSRQIEGTGLGLSLAREIARAHGGDLVLDTPVGDQTGFTLWLEGKE